MPEWKKEIEARLAPLRIEPAREAEIVEELSQHLNDRYEELVARGSSEQAAQRELLAELGSGNLSAELARVAAPMRGDLTPGVAGTGGGFLRGAWRDLRHGARLLRLDPGFSLVAILSL